MSMKLYKITNLVIILLVVTAVYQTGRLWLEGTTSHNFFYAVGEFFQQEDRVEADGNVLLATRYAVGGGDRKFSLYYPDEVGGSALLETANQTLNQIISNITRGEKMEADWQEMLESKSLVLQYDFTVQTEDYLPGYNKLNTSQRMDSFDYIVIVPAESSGISSAYFVNSQSNECIRWQASNVSSAPDLYAALEEAENTGLTYIATGQRETYSRMIRRNLFVPQWSEKTYSYAALVRQDCFGSDDNVNRSELENAVSNFFRNFAVDWSRRDESGTYIFSDSSVVVRFYPERDLLEYFSYESYDAQEQTGLLEGYQICCDLLKKDSSLKTDVYLADVSRDGNEWTYYFDYAVNNIPVELSDEIQEMIGSKHAIEMTVRDNQVRTYSRYAVNFAASDSQMLQVGEDHDFVDALNRAVEEYRQMEQGQDVQNVQNIYLAYYSEKAADTQEEQNISMKWFVELYDHLYRIDTADPQPEEAEETENTPQS